MAGQVNTARDGDVLVVTIDNPPINAGSTEVRRGLRDAIAQLAADASLRAAVLIGGGSTFIAGSDLREFGRPLEEPQLPAVIAAIEACPKPVVAALHGAALGGGFELALGCDARVAHPKALMGLPEVTLGMIPGAGGTQRLTRIVGAAQAIRMICAGERMCAEPARQLGIVDLIADGELLSAAVDLARGMRAKHRLRDVAAPVAAPQDVERAERDALRAGGGRPPVASAIEMVKAAYTLPIDEALRQERALFQDYRMGADAAALRHLFFAEREAAKPPAAAGQAEFVTRRLADTARGQCKRLVAEGATLPGIAAALRDFGFGPGPVLREVGTESGAGGAGAVTPAGSAAGSAASAASACAIDAAEIVRRVLLALVNESACLLADRAVMRATDIDVAAVRGCGFPRWRGGPVFQARRMEPAALANDLAAFCAASGVRAGDPALLAG